MSKLFTVTVSWTFIPSYTLTEGNQGQRRFVFLGCPSICQATLVNMNKNTFFRLRLRLSSNFAQMSTLTRGRTDETFVSHRPKIKSVQSFVDPQNEIPSCIMILNFVSTVSQK